MRNRWRFGVHPLWCILGLVVGGEALAQQLNHRDQPVDPLSLPRPTLRAYFTSEKIEVDGRLNEASWSQADSTDGIFWQSIPTQGVPSSERTVVRVLYDRKRLYIGAVLYDSEPQRLVAAGLEQDFQTHDSDIFGVAVDTYLDHQNAFLFAINPAGAIFDAQAFNDQAYINRAWEGIVEVRTRVHEKGWTVEMAIPFTTLRYPVDRAEQTWGINFVRRIRRRSEDSNWAPLPRQARVYKMSMAGVLTGLHGLPRSRNLWIKPYVSTGRKSGLAATTRGTEFDGGFDMKWGITSQLTLDATLFTDFSQVDVDEEQVNLTRFSLFFPEQRDFFLENAGIFNFSDVQIRNYRTGSGPQNFKLFHSRRIGLSENREPVPILGGLRLSGRAGDFDIGLLNMETRNTDRFASENFSVLRIRRNILRTSDVGLMVTHRQGTARRNAGHYNSAFGIDGNFRFFEYLVINSYIARSEEPGAGGNRGAAALQIAWRDPIWDTSLLLKSVGDQFNPEMGFVSRRGIRQAFFTVGAHPQPHLPHLFEVNPYLDVNVFTNQRGVLESREIKSGLAFTFLNSSQLTAELSTRYEFLDSPTPIAGVQVAAGQYRFALMSLKYVSDTGRKFSTNTGLTVGTFYDGRRTSLTAGMSFRPSAHWYLNARFQNNRLQLAGQRFSANLYSFRLRYGYDVRTFFSAFIQYNQAARELISNLRFNFIHAPLSDLFVVFQERRSVARAGSAVLDRLFAVKVTRLLPL